MRLKKEAAMLTGCFSPGSGGSARKRTLEKYEQGRAKPNPQAAALVLLVRKYPDTLERLERVAVPLKSLTPGHIQSLGVFSLT